MTPAEKAFTAWWDKEYPGQDPDEEGTYFFLSIFEAGWRAAESQQDTHKDIHKCPESTEKDNEDSS